MPDGQGLRAWAKSYLLKEIPYAEILEAIRIVHAGRTRITTAAGAKLLERMGMPDLTEREMEVLRLIARGSSNQEIAQALFIAEGTVKSHVNHILGKLGVSDRTQATITAIKRGIVDIA